ncbi:spliceosome-associated protein CWC27 homolog [Brevipalpus obovatus]|uniref:spliceosome-associated protein CWC27 homolog n=1 Tax=Brevipalpus obovatus TaxID=246614 RepID=UPI003D9E885C
MSEIYIQEPATSGKVILKTSLGDIEIELWTKETPKACRNFIQLCMEGYYDGTIFHRVIKKFIAQGGDPTGTGLGGESIYGEFFKDEIHSRIRFVRRGLVAMANDGKDSNGSQFFFTLGSASELQGKHTIFGKVVGKTLYNMTRFDDLEVDRNDRPLYPPKIISTEVVLNPFTDIVPRVEEKRKEEKKDEVKPKPEKKEKKDFKLLSFGDEAEEEEEELGMVIESFKEKSKSSHDIIKDDPRLSSIPAVDPLTALMSRKRQRKSSGDKNDEKTAKKSEESPEKVKKTITQNEDEKEESEDEELYESEEKRKEKKVADARKEYESLQKEIRRDKSMKKKAEKESRKKSSNPMVEEFKAENQMFKGITSNLPRGDQSEILFERFKRGIRILKEGTHSDTETDEKPEPIFEDPNAAAVFSHKFSCQNDEATILAKDANLKNEEDWYDIHDPRNPINKRRREAESIEKPAKKVER